MKSTTTNPLKSQALALLLALTTGAATATQFWSNTGTLSGWDDDVIEHLGKVEQVTNVFYPSNSSSGSETALKMTQIHDSSYSGRYHSEVVHHDAYSLGDEGFYGFAFRLQESWEFSPPQSFNLAQFIADFSDLGCDETYMPSTMVWLEGDKLNARVKRGDVCPTENQDTLSFEEVASVQAGLWHKVVLQVRWRDDETGFFKMWFDGDKVVEEFDIATTVSDGRAFQFRVGLYANGWYDSGYEGSQGTRQVWYDQVASGSGAAVGQVVLDTEVLGGA